MDGSQQYTSIQAAVNDSGHDDVVLIYPGRYQESITLNNYNITITSLFINDPDQSIINNTIIDGNVNSCISAVNGETVTINGLTLTNNENDTNVAITFSGGGVYITNYSSATISNCIIRDCIALSGGGISVSSYSAVTISNVKIFNNQALLKGGGLSFNNSSLLTIDSGNLCDIYNNKATQGMDISVNYLSYNSVPWDITLGLGSVPLTEADGYFINVHNANVTVNIAQGAIEQIDHDLYVSPDGDDSNSGLDSGSPLRTIAIAMQRIASNPDNPKTIHLAPGIYSHSANGQILPMGVKSNVKVQGAGIGETIIDGELSRTFWGAWYASNIEISGMKLMNGRSIYTYGLSFLYCTNIVVSDIDCYNSLGSNSVGITLGYSNGIQIENVILGNIEYQHDLSAIFTFECNNVYISNVIVDNLTTSDSESTFLGLIFYDSDIHLRNSIVTNISAVDAWIFLYQNIYEPFAAYNLDMSNVLIINNSVSNPSWVTSPIYIQNRYQPVQI
ncbi:MAG: right-handed parallel beta-helix repeat-containing protein, partial [Bacteroidales bacterium]